jgi:hypothetical protein
LLEAASQFPQQVKLPGAFVPPVPGGDDDGIINYFPLISRIRNDTIKLENQIPMLALQKLE